VQTQEKISQRRRGDNGRRREQKTGQSVAPPQPTNAPLDCIDALLKWMGH
jgi:hypothetical protein